MQAKKSYGQHFLAQPAIARQIAEGVEVEEIDLIVEVGPGHGMLTQYLMERPRPLIAIEADRDMVKSLQGRFPEWAGQSLIEADFLQADLKGIMQDRQTALVGNFPYNISSQILIALVDHRREMRRMVGMFQRELAERVLAQPSSKQQKSGESKAYGAISVLVQAFFSGKVLLHVKPGSFNPPPKVDSTVIVLERLPEDQWPQVDFEQLRLVVRTAFQQRRKMLRNSLKPIWPNLDADDPSLMRRPEELAVQEFTALTRQIFKP